MASFVVHLHLHQPPREDPWLGDLPRDPDAAPDHDFTARVERDCYRALLAARVHDEDGRVRRLVDTLARASFDVAPSLLAWLARERPSTYAAVLAADRAALRRTGHGAALAHPYHHTILPLLSRRDKTTEVRWGLAEFRRRFGRDAEGMWLPETAADAETLDVLAEQGLRFTVLAPHQLRAEGRGAAADGAGGDGSAGAAGAAPVGTPGRLVTASGRAIAICGYEATIAHDVAAGGLLRDGRAWAARLREAAAGDAVAGGAGLVAVALGAETFGHHHRHGALALAAMFDALEGNAAAPMAGGGSGGAAPAPPGTPDRAAPDRVENYAAYLARHPAVRPVALVGPSSGSCPHGVERWRADCGCRSDPSTHQRWRGPLREALDGLRAALAERFAREGGDLFAHVPGGADAVRDAYNDALPTARGAGDALATAGGAVPPTRDPVWARELLEMEREALAMFDSDAWFGDDVAEGPARTALAHAARAVSLAGPTAGALESRLRDALAAAPSNDPAVGSARVVYSRHARPAMPTALRVAAGIAATRAVGEAVGAAVGAAGAVPAAWSAELDEDGDRDSSDVGDSGMRGTPAGAPQAGVLMAVVPQAGTSRAVQITVADRRLGYSTTYAVTVDFPAPAAVGSAAGARAARLSDVDPRAITVLARPVGGGGPHTLDAALKLADLPEWARERVERALRRAVMRRLLDEGERDQLAAGVSTLDALASAALVRAVTLLERDRSASAVARVLGLADLTESAVGTAAAGTTGGGALVDAQTALYRLAARLPAPEHAQLAPVAYRLGFSARGWRELGEAGCPSVTPAVAHEAVGAAEGLPRGG